MSDILSLMRAGIIHFGKASYNEAIKQFDLVIKADPNNSDAFFHKANSLKALKNFDKALDSYNLSLKINPKNPEVIFQKGKCLNELKRDEDALKCFNQALYYNPSHVQCLIEKGICLNQIQMYNEALESFSKAAVIDQNSFGAFYNCGICLDLLKDRKKAIEYYDKAIALKPNYSDAYFNKGNALFEEDLQKALECYNMAIKYNEKSVDAYINRSIVLMKINNYQEALIDIEKTIKLNPKNDEAYYYKGICLEEKKEYRNAVTILDIAIDLDPENPSYVSERGKIYLELEDKLNGFTDLNSARKMLQEPKNKIKIQKKQLFEKTKTNIESIEKINVIDVIGLMEEKINFMEGNQNIKKQFNSEVKFQIQEEYLKNRENNLEKFDMKNKEMNDMNQNLKKNNKKSSQGLVKVENNINKDDLDKNKSKNINISNTNELAVNIKKIEDSKQNQENLNDENKNNLTNPNNFHNGNTTNVNFNTQINQTNITKISIKKAKKIINLSQQIKIEDVPKEFLTQIYDKLFLMSQKLKEHEEKLKDLSMKIDEIEKELDVCLKNHKSSLIKKLCNLIENKTISIKENNNLLNYFDGFISCFNRFYITSQMIIQDQFKINDSKAISICSFLVSLIPIVGQGLSTVGKGIADYLRNLKIKNEAKKFLSIACNCTELSQLIGKCALEICLNQNKMYIIEKIEKDQIENLISDNYDRCEKLSKIIENKLNFHLFNPSDKDPFFKYGECDANRIIKKFLKNEFDVEVDYMIQFVDFICKETFEDLVFVKEKKVIDKDPTKCYFCTIM